jgi:hypothetical protein
MRDGLSLLLGAEDLEITVTYTYSGDELFVLDKARHLHDALCVIVNHMEGNKCITWIWCSDLSAELNVNQYTGRTIIKRYLQLHKRRGNKKVFVLKLMHSSRGKSSRSAKSPFSEDESLMVQFRSWAGSDLETLTVNKAQAWIDITLLKDWSAEDLEYSEILYPLSRNIAACWILEADFKYERHKIFYYIDRHKGTDVLADQNKYIITKFFDEELLEYCWMHLSTRMYLQNKNLKSTSALKTKIKQERKAKDTVNLSTAIAKYLDEKVYHYCNKAGEDMVEVYADWLYSYGEAGKLPNGIPPLPKPTIPGSLMPCCQQSQGVPCQCGQPSLQIPTRHQE